MAQGAHRESESAVLGCHAANICAAISVTVDETDKGAGLSVTNGIAARSELLCANAIVVELRSGVSRHECVAQFLCASKNKDAVGMSMAEWH